MRWALALVVLIFGPMLAETRRSRRNEAALRSAGAREPAGDVYRLMQVAYPACFLAILVEGARRRPPRSIPPGGPILFGLSKALKYWAIATLGPRWTFRVLVPPGAPRITSGPYRWTRHPNYVAVAGELAGAALTARAPFAGGVSLLVFGGLMLARVAVEEGALEDGAHAP